MQDEIVEQLVGRLSLGESDKLLDAEQLQLDRYLRRKV